MRKVGKIGLVALAKAREHPALLVHVFDAKTSAAPIAPCRTLERRKHFRRRHLADALEVIHQLLLFGLELRGGRQMLQRAAAAQAEMPTTRRDSVRRRAHHADELSLIVLP